eukprot:gene12110-15176_t
MAPAPSPPRALPPSLFLLLAALAAPAGGLRGGRWW